MHVKRVTVRSNLPTHNIDYRVIDRLHEMHLTVFVIVSPSMIPPNTYNDSFKTAAAEYPLGLFIGSPIIHDPLRGSNISTLETIAFSSKPPSTYLHKNFTS